MIRLKTSAALLLLLLSSCAPEAVRPVATLDYPLRQGAMSDTAVVILPGRGDRGQDIIKYGMLGEVGSRGIQADIIAADMHFGYYKDGSATTALHEDIITPLRAKGYKNIWIAGVSAGALGAILYEHYFPPGVEGVILVSPYLGEKEFLQKILADGGIEKINPEAMGELYYLGHAWKWLRAHSHDEGRPIIYAGFGRDDKYLPNAELLSDAFGAGGIVFADGGHDWGTFKELWKRLLDEMKKAETEKKQP